MLHEIGDWAAVLPIPSLAAAEHRMLRVTPLNEYAGFGMSTESQVWVPCAHYGPPPSHGYVPHILWRAAPTPRPSPEARGWLLTDAEESGNGPVPLARPSESW
jgi:hypothetical protein